MVKLDWIEQWRRLGTTMVLFFCFYVATLILFPTASSGKEEGAAAASTEAVGGKEVVKVAPKSGGGDAGGVLGEGAAATTTGGATAGSDDVLLGDDSAGAEGAAAAMKKKVARGPPAHLAKRLAVKSRSAKTAAAKASVPSFAGEPSVQSVVVGGGCFWCIEAVMQRVKGVRAVVSGYMGGHVEDPTYEQVKAKGSGHVEVVQVFFNTAEGCSLRDVLEIFMQCHDPTDEGGQGRDRGPQYRSTIFVAPTPPSSSSSSSSSSSFSSSSLAPLVTSQRAVAEAVLAEAAAKHAPKPIATQLRDAGAFWPAEGRHQDYYNLNANKGYCRLVIHPKLKKVKHGKYEAPPSSTSSSSSSSSSSSASSPSLSAKATNSTTTTTKAPAAEPVPVDENVLNQ